MIYEVPGLGFWDVGIHLIYLTFTVNRVWWIIIIPQFNLKIFYYKINV